MIIVSAPDIIHWLKHTWTQTLEWDSGNTDKLKKHRFSTTEIDGLKK